MTEGAIQDRNRPDGDQQPNREKAGEIAQLSFEDAVTKLEAVVASLEDGDLGLEASIAAYEDGLLLARSCIKRLDEAELRVEQLSELTGDIDVDQVDAP